MNKFISALVLLLATRTLSAQALDLCTDWPEIVGGRGPFIALTGIPLTYNFRLSCLPQGAFELGPLAALYKSDMVDLRPIDQLLVSPLPAGDYLYQALFMVAQEQPQGIYAIEGCLNVSRSEDGENRCLPLPSSSFRLWTRDVRTASAAN